VASEYESDGLLGAIFPFAGPGCAEFWVRVVRNFEGIIAVDVVRIVGAQHEIRHSGSSESSSRLFEQATGPAGDAASCMVGGSHGIVSCAARRFNSAANCLAGSIGGTRHAAAALPTSAAGATVTCGARALTACTLSRTAWGLATLHIAAAVTALSAVRT
jgi:hypothetical protein